MEWIDVKDRLPEIPGGRFGVSVLVAMFDSVYEELNPGHGYEVHEISYCIISNEARKYWKYPEDIKKDFMDYYHGLNDDCKRGPCGDPVTHWMPKPNPPEIKKEKP